MISIPNIEEKEVIAIKAICGETFFFVTNTPEGPCV